MLDEDKLGHTVVAIFTLMNMHIVDAAIFVVLLSLLPSTANHSQIQAVERCIRAAYHPV
jgi:competence protein ComGC